MGKIRITKSLKGKSAAKLDSFPGTSKSLKGSGRTKSKIDAKTKSKAIDATELQLALDRVALKLEPVLSPPHDNDSLDMLVSQPSDDNALSDTDDFGDDEDYTTCLSYYEYTDKGFQLRSLRASVNKLMSRVKYGPDKEKRTCILPGGDTFSWEEDSSATSWVAVFGTKTASLVSMATRWDHYVEFEYWDWDPLLIRRPPLTHEMSKAFCDLAENTANTRQRIAQHSKTDGPFAVVCVAPGTFEDRHKDVSLEASVAISFLEDKLKYCPTLSGEETEQIAVCALYYLFGAEFKSNEIQLCGSGYWNGNIRKMLPSRVSGHVSAIGKITSDQLDHTIKDFGVMYLENVCG